MLISFKRTKVLLSNIGERNLSRKSPSTLANACSFSQFYSFHQYHHIRQFSFMSPSSDIPYPTPPVPPPSWDFTSTLITDAITKSISKSQSLIDSIIALPKEARTFEAVVRPFAIREGEMERESEPAVFMQYVSGDEAVRDSAVEGEKKLQEFGLSVLTNKDLYQVLLDVESSLSPSSRLSSEESLLLHKLLLERTRSGLALSDDKRAIYLEKRKKVLALQTDFQRVCNEEKGGIWFEKEELRGVPEDVVSGFKQGDDGRLWVTFKTPDIIPLFKFAELPATRKKAVLGYEGKTKQNAVILDEVVKLRKEIAAILGYANWAEWVTEAKMAKNSSTVLAFLNGLEDKLRPIGLKEKTKLLALKAEIYENNGWLNEAGAKEVRELRLWDYRYLDRISVEKEVGLDEEKVKEYFPVSKVVPAILDIYKTLLGVQFFKVPKENGGTTWHPDVEMYAVWDSAGRDGSKPGFLGYMHLDLFPRENKYGHAAVWGLIPGYSDETGDRKYPVVAMVANLAKETPGRPALMKHGDVVTFFHEMGHAFHGLCSKTQFARFHGTAVARDFVEAPSQMLENWCWKPEQLKSISSHYSRPEEQLPEAMIESIVKSKNINQGLFNLRQLFHGKFDMIIHTKAEDQDLTKLWVDLREETSLVNTDGEYVAGQSGFAHIVGGYEAGYYGYLYSQSFSADMFKTVFDKDPMDPVKGKLYREEILQPGGSRDEMKSLIAFLGREPNNKAFLESLTGDEVITPTPLGSPRL